jgi:hypothetical protein
MVPTNDREEKREEAEAGQGVKRDQQAQFRESIAQEFVGHEQQDKHT